MIIASTGAYEEMQRGLELETRPTTVPPQAQNGLAIVSGTDFLRASLCPDFRACVVVQAVCRLLESLRARVWKIVWRVESLVLESLVLESESESVGDNLEIRESNTWESASESADGTYI